MAKDDTFKSSREFTQGLINENLPEPILDKEEFLDVNFYPKQRDYITCTAKYQTIFGGKRAGKSAGNAGKIIWNDHFIMPEKPGYIIYASTTVEHAKKLALKRLTQVEKGLKLKWHYNLGKNQINTERGNTILFAGLKDLKAVFQMQGIPIKTCIIDEPQFIPDECLQTFIKDVVSIGMFDFEGQAQCCFSGNPFPVQQGYLWDILQNKNENYKHFHITLYDNTFFTDKHKEDFIQEELSARGETMDTLSNSSKRLIFGEWATDDGKLVLSFKDTDIFEGPIPNKENCDVVLGVDLGYDDKTALGVCYYDHETGNLYLDEEYQEDKLTIIPLAAKIKEFLSRHNTMGQNTIDTQGGSKQTALTLAVDYDIPILPSKKGDKIAWVNYMRSFNRSGRLKVRKNSALLKESHHVIFNKNFTKLDEKHFHSDIFHAVLYAFRFIYTKNIAIKKKMKENRTPLDDILGRLKDKDDQESKNKLVTKIDYGITE